jgi:5,10-methylenetetrahydrofolate reductase
MSDNGYVSGSNLEKVLKAGHFAFTGECGPPKGANVEHLNEKMAPLRGVVDAINVTDNQTAVVRMSSKAASALMVQAGLEPNFQMVCRDRNRIAMQSDILGAYALGIRNMLCLSGDHQNFGNHPQSKNVYDIDSMQLIHLVKKCGTRASSTTTRISMCRPKSSSAQRPIPLPTPSTTAFTGWPTKSMPVPISFRPSASTICRGFGNS